MLCSACLGHALDAVDPRRATQVDRVSANEGSFVALVVHLKRPKPARRRRP
jgi:hypothetical protein